ncbi:hypothetical protein PHAVU_003G211500 [Phaseolus vulgaris]|uniref:Uncharacterized protein n=1 Tax=Phaseolus vulgaris TaxID=3885 RepID=V7CBH0_PHAVU|nr:hypothetical protein PHAVU_003G211500g [Phaseolus vulgaris]ESW27547.1 hypothetical protein PHAVU_003G211500g [Phaseolus vulgaris]
MPPDVLHFRPLLSPLVQFSPSLTSPAQENHICCVHKYWQGRKGMNLTKKKLIPILVFILSVISILRLLSLNVKTSPFSTGISALFPAPQHNCSSPLSTCNKIASPTPGSSDQPRKPPNTTTTLTEKEFKVLSDLIALKSPCNLLIFGFQPQYLILSNMNAAGSTIFLDDDPDKISKVRINSNNTQIYRFEYNTPTKAGYKLLQHARQNPAACVPNPRFLQKSKCKLALKNLPLQVYEKNWDVMVVDGPSGGSPESPGRMGSIYTTSVLARAGNTSDVIVHDVDRIIEKWFSWEFLCDENLLYSKGKLWHFRIRGLSNSTRFCPVEVGK